MIFGSIFSFGTWKDSFVSLGPHRLKRFCLVLFPALLCSTLAAPSLNAAQNDDFSLNVIVLSGTSTADILGNRSNKVIELPSARLPVVVSKALVPSLVETPTVDFSKFDMPGEILFVNIHTLSAATRKSKFRWKEEEERLDLQVKDLHRSGGSFSLILKVRCNGLRLNSMKVAGRADRTQVAVQKSGDGHYLYFAFTWTDAIRFDAAKPPEPRLSKKPEAIEKKAPAYPEAVSFVQSRPEFRVAIVLNKRGRFDPKRFYILDCTNPHFAQSAMKTIIKDWRFKPGLADGLPVETLMHLDVDF